MSREVNGSSRDERILAEVDRELRAALSICPPDDFEARVLRRVADDDAPSRWNYGWLAAAALLVLAAGLFFALKPTPAAIGDAPPQIAERQPDVRLPEPARKGPAYTGSVPARKGPAYTGSLPARKGPAYTGSEPARKGPAYTGSVPARKGPAYVGSEPARKGPVYTGSEPARKGPAYAGSVPARKGPAYASASVGRGFTPRRAAEPEVIVPPNQMEAVRRLVRAVNEGRIEAPLEPSREPLSQPNEIVVQPLTVDPIPVPALESGAAAPQQPSRGA